MLLLPNALGITNETEQEPEEITATEVKRRIEEMPTKRIKQCNPLRFIIEQLEAEAEDLMEELMKGSRRAGKQAAMDAAAEEYMSSNPGARLAKVSIIDGQEQVKVTEAGGPLQKHADGIYRPGRNVNVTGKTEP